jgi:hypothetical protein
MSASWIIFETAAHHCIEDDVFNGSPLDRPLSLKFIDFRVLLRNLMKSEQSNANYIERNIYQCKINTYIVENSEEKAKVNATLRVLMCR